MKRRFHRIDRKIIVYLFFLFISSFLWLINALSKQYTTMVSFPVRYINYPENYIPTEKLPSSFVLQLTGYGYNLLRYKYSTPAEPLIIDLRSNFRKNTGQHNFNVTFIAGRHIETIKAQLDDQISLDRIIPDTLSVTFSKLSKRKIPVEPKIKFSVQPQFVMSGNIEINPPEVLISGPSVIVDSLLSIETASENFSNLTKTIEETVELVANGNIEIVPRKVKITIPVERLTEAELLIQVKIINVPEGVDVHIFPKKIKTNFRTGMSFFKTIKPDDFTLVVDYDEIKTTNGNKVKIQALKQPKHVSQVTFSPQYVEFLIEK